MQTVEENNYTWINFNMFLTDMNISARVKWIFLENNLSRTSVDFMQVPISLSNLSLYSFLVL